MRAVGLRHRVGWKRYSSSIKLQLDEATANELRASIREQQRQMAEEIFDNAFNRSPMAETFIDRKG